MDKQVLVTGATGFIGLQTIYDLLEAGYRVRGTMRTLDRADNIRDILRNHTPLADMLECVPADLSSDAGWDTAVAGCDYVLHVASPAPAVQPKNPDDLINPARDGTLHVLRAARRAGVRRVVMTSSSAAISRGAGKDQADLLTENDWADPDDTTNTPYARSKTIAEKAAWSFVESPEGEGLELAAINPVMVMGPALGPDTSASLELIRQIMSGSLPRAPKLSFTITDVRDVSAAHIRAMEKEDAAGKRFIIAESTLWVTEIADILREAFPAYTKKIPTGTLPDWVVRLLSITNPPLKTVTPDLGSYRQYANDRLKSELGIQPIPARDSIIASADALMKLGEV